MLETRNQIAAARSPLIVAAVGGSVQVAKQNKNTGVAGSNYEHQRLELC